MFHLVRSGKYLSYFTPRMKAVSLLYRDCHAEWAFACLVRLFPAASIEYAPLTALFWCFPFYFFCFPTALWAPPRFRPITRGEAPLGRAQGNRADQRIPSDSAGGRHRAEAPPRGASESAFAPSGSDTNAGGRHAARHERSAPADSAPPDAQADAATGDHYGHALSGTGRRRIKGYTVAKRRVLYLALLNYTTIWTKYEGLYDRRNRLRIQRPGILRGKRVCARQACDGMLRALIWRRSAYCANMTRRRSWMKTHGNGRGRDQ